MSTKLIISLVFLVYLTYIAVRIKIEFIILNITEFIKFLMIKYYCSIILLNKVNFLIEQI